MKQLETQVSIHASVEEVWQVLMHWEDYSSWNPFIVSIEGTAKVGTKLTNTLTLPRRKPQVFKPKIVVIEPNRELRWIGHLGLKGIFDGEHYFKLSPTDNQKGTSFVQGEKFSGVLNAFIMKQIGNDTLNAFERMNAALKKRVEQKNTKLGD